MAASTRALSPYLTAGHIVSLRKVIGHTIEPWAETVPKLKAFRDDLIIRCNMVREAILSNPLAHDPVTRIKLTISDKALWLFICEACSPRALRSIPGGRTLTPTEAASLVAHGLERAAVKDEAVTPIMCNIFLEACAWFALHMEVLPPECVAAEARQTAGLPIRACFSGQHPRVERPLNPFGFNIRPDPGAPFGGYAWFGSAAAEGGMAECIEADIRSQLGGFEAYWGPSASFRATGKGPVALCGATAWVEAGQVQPHDYTDYWADKVECCRRARGPTPMITAGFNCTCSGHPESITILVHCPCDLTLGLLNFLPPRLISEAAEAVSPLGQSYRIMARLINEKVAQVLTLVSQIRA